MRRRPQVVPGRLELPTSTLSVWRSNQLSYRTSFKARGRIMHSPPAFPLVSIYKQNKAAAKKHRETPHREFLPLFLFTYIIQLTVLSRKEVFQPHLPVRLPCYDLAPITGLALGRSSRLRTSGTPGFHGLTGGVYKARERIHRAMADARLLANPASWGRVADPNPN